MAVAGSILAALYHMIRDGVPYGPPEPRQLDAEARARKAARLARQIKTLGFDVQLQAPA